MTTLRGLAATGYAVAKTFVVSAPTMIEGALGRVTTEDVDRRLASWSQGIVAQARIDLEVRGLERVPPGRAFVLMSNHQSHVDVPIIFSTWPGTLRMVAKAELFRIPVFGPALHAAGFISVERSGDRKQAVEAMREAAAAIRSGVSIWIAPEGTRSETGRLGTFKRGGFLLARDTGAQIVPIAVDGSRHILPKHAVVMTPGVPVRVTYGAPIDTGGRALEAVMEDVRRFLGEHVTGAL